MKTIAILVMLSVACFIVYKGYQLVKKKTPSTGGGISTGGTTIPKGDIPTRDFLEEDFPEELKQE